MAPEPKRQDATTIAAAADIHSSLNVKISTDSVFEATDEFSHTL